MGKNYNWNDYYARAFRALYGMTLEGLRGKFSRDELLIILDVSNGWWLEPAEIAGQGLVHEIEDYQVSDDCVSPQETTPDQIDFVKRLEDLTIFERACLEIWGQKFFESPDKDFEDYVSALL